MWHFSVYGNGELTILHNPTSIDFKGSEKLESDSLSDVLSASLGYTVAHPSAWSGLYINKPFNLPDNIVAVVVDGVEQLKIQQDKSPQYSIIGSTSGSAINDFIETVEQHGRVVDIDLKQGYDGLNKYSNLFGEIHARAPNKKTSALKAKSHPEDKLFLQQLDIISTISESLDKLSAKPELLLFRVSLRDILSEHGIGSSAAIEAVELLSNSIQQLSEAVESAYGDNVVVAIVSSNDELRSKREVPQARDGPITPIVSNIYISQN